MKKILVLMCAALAFAACGSSSDQGVNVKGNVRLLEFYPSELVNLNVGLVALDAQGDSSVQYWVVGQTNGDFVIEGVEPGKYSVHAYADEVFGEYKKSEVEIIAGKEQDLGYLYWMPKRNGRELISVGVANRTGAEFALAEFGIDAAGAAELKRSFPDRIEFVSGDSNMGKDWPALHMGTDPYYVGFNHTETPVPGSKCTLSLGICASTASALEVKVNGKLAGEINLSAAESWYEAALSFEGLMLEDGKNQISLRLKDKSANAGLIYDCIRLELE